MQETEKEVISSLRMNSLSSKRRDCINLNLVMDQNSSEPMKLSEERWPIEVDRVHSEKVIVRHLDSRSLI